MNRRVLFRSGGRIDHQKQPRVSVIHSQPSVETAPLRIAAMPHKRPRPRTRRVAASDRKQLILEAGLPLFASQGLRHLSTRELARVAGVSEALLFKHFPTRQVLYQEIYLHCARRLPLEETNFADLPPTCMNLVRLIYLNARAVLVCRSLELQIAMRMMGDSLLDDGAFARLLLGNPVINAFRTKVVECIEAGIAARQIAAGGPSPNQRFWLARNVATQAYYHLLPADPVVDYEGELMEVVRQATLFGLRGIGLRESLITRHAAPEAMRSWERDGEFRLGR
jgi:AcrR family transcriptional regulator